MALIKGQLASRSPWQAPKAPNRRAKEKLAPLWVLTPAVAANMAASASCPS